MKWNRCLAAVAAVTFTVSAFLTSCGNTSKAKVGEETENASEMVEEYAAGAYDWTKLNISEKGESKRTSGKVPYAYLVPEGYYQTNESDKLKEGVRRQVYSIRLTGLLDESMMANINTVVSDAETALRDDVSWINEEKKADLLASVEDAAVVEPMNYSAAGITVFGHILSINILYLHVYNVNNADGDHLYDETVDEGRLLMNFNLRDGKVISLPSLFYDDVDYISLLAGYMNKVGAELGYRFAKSVNGFPDEYDVYCISNNGLVMGLTDGNPFLRDGEENWFSINLSDLIASMAVDPEETRLYFNNEVTFRKLAFQVKDISFKETPVKDLFSEEEIRLPLVAGIGAAGVINEDLENWYRDITDPEKYPDKDLSGGSISYETQAPSGLVNITVFIYSASENEYMTMARCYDAKTGKKLRVGDLLTLNAITKYGAGVAAATNFRVSNEFIIGIPEQQDVPEYFLTEAEDMDMSRYE